MSSTSPGPMRYRSSSATDVGCPLVGSGFNADGAAGCCADAETDKPTSSMRTKLNISRCVQLRFISKLLNPNNSLPRYPYPARQQCLAHMIRAGEIQHRI